MERFLLWKNDKGKEILKLIQENYDIKSAQDLSSALKDIKGAFEPKMVPKMLAMYQVSKIK